MNTAAMRSLAGTDAGICPLLKFEKRDRGREDGALHRKIDTYEV